MISYGVINAMIKTDDIEHLPSEVLDQLDCGDFVIKVSGSEEHLYQVKYRDRAKEEIALVYCDYHTIEELYYEKGESGWGDVVKEVRDLDTLFA